MNAYQPLRTVSMNTSNKKQLISKRNIDSIVLNPQTIKDLSNALVNTVIKTTQEEINMNSSIIYYYQSQEYYVAYLLQIINTNLRHVDKKTNQILVTSAFSQLKAIVRLYKYQGGDQDKRQTNKQCLMNSIIQISFNIASIQNRNLLYKYLKLLKDIISISHQDTVLIYPQVIKSIERSINQPNIIYLLPVYLNIFLGIISNGQKNYSKNYIEMIQAVHPLLYQFVIKGQQKIHKLYDSFDQSTNRNMNFLNNYLQYKRKYQQILYQSIKLIYKAISHKKFYKDLQSHLLKWIQVSLSRVQYIDSTFTIAFNQQRQGFKFNPHNIGNKGNDQFNYFHGKKWALKFINVALSKYFIKKESNKKSQDKQTTQPYENIFSSLPAIFQIVWNYRWPHRIQKELLKCIELFICSKPKLVAQQYAAMLSQFQAKMLPKLMALTQKEMQILQQNPIEFISQQDQITNKQSIRMIAASLWVKIATIEYSFNPSIKKSHYLHNSFFLIKSWVQNTEEINQSTRDSGCFLLIKLSKEFGKQQEILKKLNPLINGVVEKNLANLNPKNNFTNLLRVLQLFTAYKTVLSAQLINHCKSIIIELFTKYEPKANLLSEQIILLLHSCKAFCRLIKGSEAIKKQIGIQNVKMIICKALLLVEKTSFDEFIKEANNILTECINDVSDFATQIAFFLQSWFKQYSEKDVSHLDSEDKYNPNYKEIAKGTLSIFETLIYFVRNGHKEVTKIIEKEIISIIFYLFSREDNSQFYEQINQQAIWLLMHFLNNRDKNIKLNPQIMKVCKIIILRLAGLHQNVISQLQQLKKKENNKIKIELYNMYLNCHSMAQNGFQQYVGVMRSFIRYLPYGEDINIKEMKILNTINYTECLAYLPYRFFSEKKLKLTDQGRCFSLLMLIFYYQRHQQQQNKMRVHLNFNAFTLTIIKKTICLYKQRPAFAKYNVQLFCLWLFEVKDKFPVYFKSWKNSQMQSFFRDIFVYEHKLGVFGLQQIKTYEQQIRCILGIGSLLRLIKFFKSILQVMPFQTLSSIIKYAVNFASSRIDDEQMLLELQQEDYEQDKFSQQGQKCSNAIFKENQILDINYFDQFEESSSSHYLQFRFLDQENKQQSKSPNYLQFQEYEDQNSQTPLQYQNQRIFLLTSLQQLQTADQQTYWDIVRRQGCNRQIINILQNCQCLKQNSEYANLKYICDISGEIDEPYETESD